MSSVYPPLIPPGEYEVALQHFETRSFRGAAKIYMWFRVTEPGEGFGAILPRYYNAERLLGKPARGGRFKVGLRSNFLREYVRIHNTRPPRLDRIPMDCWRNRLIRARVETVKQDYEQRQHHELLRYSVIRELLGAVEVGTELPSPSPVPTPIPSPTPTLKPLRANGSKG